MLPGVDRHRPQHGHRRRRARRTTDAAGPLPRARCCPSAPTRSRPRSPASPPRSAPNLTLTIGQTLTVDVHAEGRRGAQEEVTVTAEAPDHRGGAHAPGLDGGRARGRQPARERPQLHRLRADHAGRHAATSRSGDISFAGQRGTLNSLVIDGADNNNTFFGQTARPHRLRPRPLPVQPGRGAGVPGEPQRLLGGVRPRGRGGHQRGDQVGHQRLPRLGLRVLPRQDAQREQLRRTRSRPRSAPRAPFRIHQFGGSLGGPIAEGQGLLLPLLRRPAPDASRTRSVPSPCPAPCPPTPTPRRGLALVRQPRPATTSARATRTCSWPRSTTR